MNTSKNKLLEWSGVITAIIYSILVALNIGAEFVGNPGLKIISLQYCCGLKNIFPIIHEAASPLGLHRL